MTSVLGPRASAFLRCPRQEANNYKQRGELDNHRVDWLPAVSVGLVYQPAEWVRTEITYEHYDSHSNADGESWRESTAVFSVSVGF